MTNGLPNYFLIDVILLPLSLIVFFYLLLVRKIYYQSMKHEKIWWQIGALEVVTIDIYKAYKAKVLPEVSHT